MRPAAYQPRVGILSSSRQGSLMAARSTTVLHQHVLAAFHFLSAPLVAPTFSFSPAPRPLCGLLSGLFFLPTPAVQSLLATHEPSESRRCPAAPRRLARLYLNSKLSCRYGARRPHGLLLPMVAPLALDRSYRLGAGFGARQMKED